MEVIVWLLKQKNSEGEMYSFNWYHTEPSLKFFITSTKYAMLLFAHTNLYTYGRLVDNNEAKRKFFRVFE